ncbi:MAG: restriction endonuclease subunit S [Pirellulales bacterium]
MSGRSKSSKDVEAPAESKRVESDFPKGWTSAALGDLVAFMLGGDWGTEAAEASPDYVKVRVVRGTDFRHWQESRAATAAERAVKKSSLEKRSLKPGDIVVEVSGGGPSQPVGRSVLIDEAAIESSDQPLVCSNFFRLVRLRGGVESAFVNHFLNFSVRSGAFDEFQTQTTNLRNLNFTDYLTKTFVPLPPFAEQCRIVAKLEAVLAKVATAQARLSHLPTLLRRFRQSVLAAACSGKLTAHWRMEHSLPVNAPDLDAATPDLVATDLPNGWHVKTLNDCCAKIIDGNYGAEYPKKDEFISSGIPFLTSAAISEDGGVLDTEVRYISPEKHAALRKAQTTIGDVLFTNRGARVGATTLLTDSRFQISNIGPQVTRLAANPELLVPKFLFFWMRTSQFKEVMRDRNGGSAMNFLNLTVTKSLPMVLPPLFEQQEIVRRVETLFAFADQIEARLKHTNAYVDKLTPSLLAKAFSGELVPTEANLAEREGRDYESAEQLLEGIHNTQSMSAPQAKRGRKVKA